MQLVVPVGDHDHVRGPSNARVTLVEYADFECPYCGTASAVLRRLQQALGDELRVVFRHFPVSHLQPNAVAASEMAEAAACQGKFWAMHDALFRNQDRLSRGELGSIAADAGLDLPRLRHDASSDRVQKRVVRDMLGGRASGVELAPAFFLDGRLYGGLWDYAFFLRELVTRGGIQ